MIKVFFVPRYFLADERYRNHTDVIILFVKRLFTPMSLIAKHRYLVQLWLIVIKDWI